MLGRVWSWGSGALLLAQGCWTAPNPAYSDGGATEADTNAAQTGTSGDPVSSATEPQPSDSSGDPLPTAEGSSGDPPPMGDCPAGLSCEAIPDGWTPVIRPPMDDPSQCPASTVAGSIFETEPLFDCQCDCGIADDSCTLVWQLNSPACDLPYLDQTGCGNTSGALVDGNYYADMQTPSCVANDALLELDPPREQPVCELGDMAARCGEGTWCAPSGTAACLITPGRAECPAGFEQRTLVASSWTSPDCELECGGCAFGCPEQVTLWTAAGCMGDGGVVVPADGTCNMPPDNINFYSMSYDHQPTCVTAEIIGVDAIGGGEQTLCCR